MTNTSLKYEVGYAKPPQNTRFKKGKSGNPGGRKKGSKNKITPAHEEKLQAILLTEAYRKIKVNDGNKQVSMSMAEAIIRSLAVTAAKGQARSQKIFIEMLTHTERSKKQFYIDALERMIDYKYSWEEEIKRCKKAGITPPEPLPHPDDIHIDLRIGQVDIIGPLTPSEKIRWDLARKTKIAHQEEVKELEQMLIDDPNCPYKQAVLDDIEWDTGVIDKMDIFLTTKVSLIPNH